MPKKNGDKEVYISDTGIIASNHQKNVTLFVLLCRVLSVTLAILGVLAFVEGNF